MKRTLLVLSILLVVFVAVFAVVVLRPVRKVKAGGGCSNASLSGGYALVMKGQYEYIDYGQEWDMSMLATFDGNGNLSGSNLWATYYGAPLPTAPAAEQFTGGTYTVNYDCTVEIYIPKGIAVFYGDQVYLVGVVTTPQHALGIGGFGILHYPWAGTFDAKQVPEGKMRPL
jgi:hypothetical protein